MDKPEDNQNTPTTTNTNVLHIKYSSQLASFFGIEDFNPEHMELKDAMESEGKFDFESKLELDPHADENTIEIINGDKHYKYIKIPEIEPAPDDECEKCQKKKKIHSNMNNNKNEKKTTTSAMTDGSPSSSSSSS